MSTARITAKNVTAVAASPAAVLTAIASRDVAKAREWVTAHAADLDAATVTTHGSYDDLLADGGVEAVYIPLPTAFHGEWSEKAAAAGKHVLCEKPATCTLADLRRATAAAAARGLVWMDGVMFMHHERLALMRRHLTPNAEGVTEIGRLRRVTCGFTFSGDAGFHADNIRVKKALEPHGALGDLGWYCIRFALWAFGWDLPTRVAAVSHAATSEGVPLEVTATLVFPGDRVATFDCGFSTAFRQWAEVAGTSGHVKLDDFVIARSHDRVTYTLTKRPDVVDRHRRVADEVTDVEVSTPVHGAAGQGNG
jgi:predicted dehydrogenase